MADSQAASHEQATIALAGTPSRAEPDWFADYLDDLLPSAAAPPQNPPPTVQSSVDALPVDVPSRQSAQTRFKSQSRPQASLVSADWVDQLPTDQPLAPTQKEQLQRLFDRALTQVEPFHCDHPSAPAQEAADLFGSQPEVHCQPLDVVQVTLAAESAEAPMSAPLIEPEPAPPVNGQVAIPIPVAMPIPVAPVYREHWSGADAQGRPDWAQARFDVLLFHTRGITLGIPLISLGHIYWQREALSAWPGAQAWFMGMKPLGQEALHVVDAGQYFLPDRPVKVPDPDGDELPTTPDFTLLQLAGSLWSLAVEGVANPVVVTDSDIQWRSFHAGSPWLAGAIKKHLCVLLDPPALIKALNWAGKESRVTP